MGLGSPKVSVDGLGPWLLWLLWEQARMDILKAHLPSFHPNRGLWTGPNNSQEPGQEKKNCPPNNVWHCAGQGAFGLSGGTFHA